MRAPVRSVGNSGSSGERHRRGTLQSTEATGAALYDELVVAVAVLGSGGGLRGEGQCYRLVNLAISAKARSPVRPSFGTSIARRLRTITSSTSSSSSPSFPPHPSCSSHPQNQPRPISACNHPHQSSNNSNRSTSFIEYRIGIVDLPARRPAVTLSPVAPYPPPDGAIVNLAGAPDDPAPRAPPRSSSTYCASDVDASRPSSDMTNFTAYRGRARRSRPPRPPRAAPACIARRGRMRWRSRHRRGRQ